MTGQNSAHRIGTKTFTFRLYQDTLEKLSSVAKKEKISVNVVAQRALRRYTEWEIIADRFQFMSVTPQLLERLMSWVPEENARELGESRWKSVFRPLATSFFMRQGVESGAAVLELLGVYGRRFRFDRMTRGSKHILVIKHDMGEKWSLFYEGMLDAMLKENFREELKAFHISSTDNQVVAEISTGALSIGDEPKRIPHFLETNQTSS